MAGMHESQELVERMQLDSSAELELCLWVRPLKGNVLRA